MVSVRGEVGVVGVPLCLWLQALYVSTCVSLCAYWYVCVSLFTICLCVDEAGGCYEEVGVVGVCVRVKRA